MKLLPGLPRVRDRRSAPDYQDLGVLLLTIHRTVMTLMV